MEVYQITQQSYPVLMLYLLFPAVVFYVHKQIKDFDMQMQLFANCIQF
jgi:hypothetical protein